jgi:hypothetical protein
VPQRGQAAPGRLVRQVPDTARQLGRELWQGQRTEPGYRRLKRHACLLLAFLEPGQSGV